LAYVAVPLLDAPFGNCQPKRRADRTLKGERYYGASLHGLHASHWSWTWFHMLGAGLSAGLVNGIALTVGYELGQKMNNAKHALAGKLALAS
jgi:hypothetical protein